MACQRCKSERLLNVNAKCSDQCSCSINDNESDDYVPQDVLIGEDGFGDYVSFCFCLDCGQMKGKFPQRIMRLERGKVE